MVYPRRKSTPCISATVSWSRPAALAKRSTIEFTLTCELRQRCSHWVAVCSYQTCIRDDKQLHACDGEWPQVCACVSRAMGQQDGLDARTHTPGCT